MKNEAEVLLVTAFIALIVVIIHLALLPSLVGVGLGGVWNALEVNQRRKRKDERN